MIAAAGHLEGMTPHLVAVAIGLLVGVERERHETASAPAGPTGRTAVAGTRTFALLALTGSIAGALGPEVVAAAMLGATLVLVAGYFTTRSTDPGITTEVAGLAVTGLGALCHDEPATAAGLAVALAVVLESKQVLRRFVREVITDIEVRDALTFFVLAAVIWPLLPDRAYGPDGFLVPRDLWRLVVVLAAVSWLGYLATRLMGPRRGILVTGLSGGFVSATATTAAMGRLHRTLADGRGPLAGAVMASVATCAQLVVVIGVTDGELARSIAPPVLAGGAVLAVVAAVLMRGQVAGEGEGSTSDRRPMALVPTLTVAAVLGLALSGAKWASDHVSNQAGALAGAVAGFADVHAASLAVTTLVHEGQLAERHGVAAIGAALATNTVSKLVAAAVAGRARYALALGAALAPAVVIVGVGLWWVA